MKGSGHIAERATGTERRTEDSTSFFSDDNFGSESGSDNTNDSMTIPEKVQALTACGIGPIQPRIARSHNRMLKFTLPFLWLFVVLCSLSLRFGFTSQFFLS